MSTPFIDEDRATPNPDRAALRRLLHFTAGSRGVFGRSLGLILLGAALQLGAARGLGQLVQLGLVERSSAGAGYWAAVTLLLELGAVLTVWAGRRGLAVAGSRTVLAVRTRLFEHIHRLPLSYYDRQPLGRTVTRVSHDVEGLEDFFSGTFGRVVMLVATGSLSLGGMLIADVRLGGLLVIAALPSLALTFGTRRLGRELNRDMARHSSAINARMAEYLSGMGVIRAFALERWTRALFGQRVVEYLRSCIRANRFYSWLRPVTEILCQLPLLVLLWIGGQEVLTGALNLGLFVAFFRYAQRFSGPITELSREIHTVQLAFASADRITAFLDAPVEEVVLGPDGHRSAAAIRGEVVFERVSMAYDGERSVIRDLSFTVPAGARVGLVGATGAGKTTTVSLLARLYEFQSGEIRLDGVPLREYRRAELRDQIGVVTQDVVMVRGSIAENLSMGTAVDPAAMRQAAEITGLLRALDRSSRTLDSVVLDRGANLSGGERQLVALTRTLLQNPGLLVLDEATASIDPALERELHDAIERIMAGRTCFVIAHRLATLRGCDHILVFREGHIVEQGSHEVLLAAGGYYAELTGAGEPGAGWQELDLHLTRS